jgi:neutral ceramidase
VDSVKVSFRSANPRNNQRIEGTFLTVDRLEDDGSWRTVYIDGDWCTRFIWKGGLGHFGISFAEIIWDVPSETPQGLYRICHFGTRKTLLGDSESAFFHIPDWLLSNVVGSHAIGLLLQLARQVLSLSESLRHTLGYDLSRSRYKDFEGCTKTFLITIQHERPQN